MSQLYGDDAPDAAGLRPPLRELFRTDCDVYFVFNGTAAKLLALAFAVPELPLRDLLHRGPRRDRRVRRSPSSSQRLQAADRRGRQPGRQLGKASRPKPSPPGHQAQRHPLPQAQVVSVTQATELGTIYMVDELRAVTQAAKSHGLKIHMDGARFANAVAALSVHPAEITTELGVDVLCFGGTKNGLPVARPWSSTASSARIFAYRVKQAGQLAAWMRFISAPWLGTCWKHFTLDPQRRACQRHGRRLFDALQGTPGFSSARAPGQFGSLPFLPEPAIARLHAQAGALPVHCRRRLLRFMCSGTRPSKPWTSSPWP